jgi:hypothetical protein
VALWGLWGGGVCVVLCGVGGDGGMVGCGVMSGCDCGVCGIVVGLLAVVFSGNGVIWAWRYLLGSSSSFAWVFFAVRI